MKKTILFPFDIKEDNRKTYCESIRKAQAEKADLVLFTSLSEEATEAEKDHVYFHLLQLNGYYQSHCNDWSSTADVNIQRVICTGDTMQNLSDTIQATRPNWIVNNNRSEEFNQERIGEVLTGYDRSL